MNELGNDLSRRHRSTTSPVTTSRPFLRHVLLAAGAPPLPLCFGGITGAARLRLLFGGMVPSSSRSV